MSHLSSDITLTVSVLAMLSSVHSLLQKFDLLVSRWLSIFKLKVLGSQKLQCFNRNSSDYVRIQLSQAFLLKAGFPAPHVSKIQPTFILDGQVLMFVAPPVRGTNYLIVFGLH